jgi:hypothetical protein
MSLGKQLVERLRKGDLDDSLESITVREGELRATLVLFDKDRYSVTMHSLHVLRGIAPTDAAQSRSERLDTLARATIAQLSFLEEPLTIVERDAASGLSQLRSTQPQRDEHELHYWEVELLDGEHPSATLTRYHWAPGMVEREAMPYPVAFAHAGRLADALANALNTME